jgi:hypothetical protein
LREVDFVRRYGPPVNERQRQRRQRDQTSFVEMRVPNEAVAAFETMTPGL